MLKDFFVSLLLDRYGLLLTEKQFRIMNAYYNLDLSLSEIAENEGITRQGVSDFVKCTEAQLYEYEEKLAVLGKLSELKALCKEENVSKAVLDYIENF